ncbi:putative mitochondrial protein [Andalucia godoyi]|uniref:E3 ubiquitin-protein ligase n=1 Tax=Andalucia godoyi TaxID=505711 RepID=A0A8K0AFY2_ANDGO|nr:putative mitochondrial protein [Andalucia godoyi]|eukprot:ANDGO_03438.mRNA.1 putative mitochondrial protein
MRRCHAISYPTPASPSWFCNSCNVQYCSRCFQPEQHREHSYFLTKHASLCTNLLPAEVVLQERLQKHGETAESKMNRFKTLASLSFHSSSRFIRHLSQILLSAPSLDPRPNPSTVASAQLDAVSTLSRVSELWNREMHVNLLAEVPDLVHARLFADEFGISDLVHWLCSCHATAVDPSIHGSVANPQHANHAQSHFVAALAQVASERPHLVLAFLVSALADDHLAPMVTSMLLPQWSDVLLAIAASVGQLSFDETLNMDLRDWVPVNELVGALAGKRYPRGSKPVSLIYSLLKNLRIDFLERRDRLRLGVSDAERFAHLVGMYIQLLQPLDHAVPVRRVDSDDSSYVSMLHLEQTCLDTLYKTVGTWLSLTVHAPLRRDHVEDIAGHIDALSLWIRKFDEYVGDIKRRGTRKLSVSFFPVMARFFSSLWTSQCGALRDSGGAGAGAHDDGAGSIDKYSPLSITSSLPAANFPLSTVSGITNGLSTIELPHSIEESLYMRVIRSSVSCVSWFGMDIISSRVLACDVARAHRWERNPLGVKHQCAWLESPLTSSSMWWDLVVLRLWMDAARSECISAVVDAFACPEDPISHVERGVRPEEDAMEEKLRQEVRGLDCLALLVHLVEWHCSRLGQGRVSETQYVKWLVAANGPLPPSAFSLGGSTAFQPQHPTGTSSGTSSQAPQYVQITSASQTAFQAPHGGGGSAAGQLIGICPPWLPCPPSLQVISKCTKRVGDMLHPIRVPDSGSSIDQKLQTKVDGGIVGFIPWWVSQCPSEFQHVRPSQFHVSSTTGYEEVRLCVSALAAAFSSSSRVFQALEEWTRSWNEEERVRVLGDAAHRCSASCSNSSGARSTSQVSGKNTTSSSSSSSSCHSSGDMSESDGSGFSSLDPHDSLASSLSSERAAKARRSRLAEISKKQALVATDIVDPQYAKPDEVRFSCILCRSESAASEMCTVAYVGPSVHSASSPSPSMIPISVSTCSHYIHPACFNSFFNELVKKSFFLTSVRLDKNEFQCPACKSLSNTILPCGVPPLSGSQNLLSATHSGGHGPASIPTRWLRGPVENFVARLLSVDNGSPAVFSRQENAVDLMIRVLSFGAWLSLQSAEYAREHVTALRQMWKVVKDLRAKTLDAGCTVYVPPTVTELGSGEDTAADSFSESLHPVVFHLWSLVENVAVAESGRLRKRRRVVSPFEERALERILEDTESVPSPLLSSSGLSLEDSKIHRRLISLPHDYASVIQQHGQAHHLCLICGKTFHDVGSHLHGLHALALQLPSGQVLCIVRGVAHRLPSPYTDALGERDVDCRRGVPLTLHEDYYVELQQRFFADSTMFAT